MNSKALTPLEIMKQQLAELTAKKTVKRYQVPALWVEAGKKPVDGKPAQLVEPGAYFLSHISAVEKNALPGIDPCRSLNQQIPGGEGGSWINKSSIFNMFVRLTAAYDHDADGRLGGSKNDVTLNEEGIRESGTFLKAIAMLGYIKSLGFDTIHLLPVTSIGRDGNKGELGSPYAIRNPYKIEESQADTLIQMTAEQQFRAFIQACHMLGIRVVAEFVFRTASKDSDWVSQHPDWFYWIDAAIHDREPGETDPAKVAAGYGNPVFTSEELKKINEKVAAGDMNELPPPSKQYRNFFKLPPEADTVKLNENGQMVGKARDGVSGKLVDVRIPGAFADWPPDDNQPPWGDVTYLRMYLDEDIKNPQFNYIAFNTIRMYDNRLARPEMANTSLWESIINLIPTYQQEYGIDGVMVDMGHAVPVSLMQKLIGKARSIDPNFAFLSENFEIKQDSVEAGYNAVVGYAWWVEYRRDGMYDLLNHVGNQGVPLPFFAAVENHNTPRAAGRPGGEKYARYAFLVNTMLPNAVPFIHSGQELGETMPVNTGLDFSNSDLEALKGKSLALFDISAYRWDGSHPMLGFVARVLELRRQHLEIVSNTSSHSFCMLQTGEADAIAFIRRAAGKHLMVLFNRDLDNSLNGTLSLEWCLGSGIKSLENLLESDEAKKNYSVENQKMHYQLEPGECRLFAW